MDRNLAYRRLANEVFGMPNRSIFEEKGPIDGGELMLEYLVHELAHMACIGMRPRDVPRPFPDYFVARALSSRYGRQVDLDFNECRTSAVTLLAMEELIDVSNPDRSDALDQHIRQSLYRNTQQISINRADRMMNKALLETTCNQRAQAIVDFIEDQLEEIA